MIESSALLKIVLSTIFMKTNDVASLLDAADKIDEFADEVIALFDTAYPESACNGQINPIWSKIITPVLDDVAGRVENELERYLSLNSKHNQVLTMTNSFKRIQNNVQNNSGGAATEIPRGRCQNVGADRKETREDNDKRRGSGNRNRGGHIPAGSGILFGFQSHYNTPDYQRLDTLIIR